MSRYMEDTTRTAITGSRWAAYTPSILLAEKAYTPAVSTPPRVQAMQAVESKIRAGTLYKEATKKAVIQAFPTKVAIAQPAAAPIAAAPVVSPGVASIGGNGKMALAAGASLLAKLPWQQIGQAGMSLISGIAGAPTGVGVQPGARETIYSAAYAKGGRIYVQGAQGWKAIGYTPTGAKKRYRTKRRRKRLTKRDEVILATAVEIAQKGGSPAVLMAMMK